MSPYPILLVEDDTATRTRLSRVIDSHPELALAGSAGTLAEGHRLLAAVAPRILLTDLGLPDGSGIDLIREASARDGGVESMVITVFGDEQHVVAAIEAGASGYILKDGTSEYIGESIIELVNGGSPISASIARHLLKRFRPADREAPAPPANAPDLTARETEILALVAKGFTYAEIAAALSLSVHTVTSHVKHIYRKLSVGSRGEAVFEAMQLGLIDINRSD